MASPDPYLPGHGDTRFRITHHDLELTYKVATNRLDERARLDIEILEPTRRIELDLYALTVNKVLLDGHKAKYRRALHKVVVEVGDRVPGDHVVLELAVSGKPRPMPGVHGEAGWEELTDGAMVGSQPQGAPSWFPCNDDAASKGTYRISVTTDSEYDVASNGSLVGKRKVGGATQWIYQMDRPMAPYLATVQIGKYCIDGRSACVPVEVWHPKGSSSGEGTAFGKQGAMMDLFCSLFGPYPFSEYRAIVVDDVLEIPLEAQGLSTFGRNFLSPSWDHERLVAHELAHQWFGNAVTSTQLADIWLHEGFACYSEWLWSDHRRQWRRSETVQQQAERHYRGLPRDLGDRTLTAPGMRDMFDDWVYKRGALAVHAVRCLVGDDAFFAILQSWVASHLGGVVTTPMFVDHCCAQVPSVESEIRTTLHAWLEEPTLPPLPVLGD